MSGEWDEIDSLAGNYRPNAGQTPGPEILPEGAYSVEIAKAELVRTPEMT